MHIYTNVHGSLTGVDIFCFNRVQIGDQRNIHGSLTGVDIFSIVTIALTEYKLAIKGVN
jgi:hypothetical protein